jgi:hypothetical protein
MHLPWVEPLGRFLFVQSLCMPKILPRKFHGALYIQEAPLAPPALGSVKMLFSIPPAILWPGLVMPWDALGILWQLWGIMLPHMGNTPNPTWICFILLYTLDYSLA